MKKLLLILALIPLFCSCSNDSNNDEIDKAKRDYEWLQKNIEGCWDEVFYEGENLFGVLTPGYACFEKDMVFSKDLFGQDGERYFQLKYTYGLIYIIVGNVEYRVLSVNESNGVIFLNRQVGELKKRSGGN